jgi:hypothetical protein
LWLAETSQHPISQTTWQKVTSSHCNHMQPRQTGGISNSVQIKLELAESFAKISGLKNDVRSLHGIACTEKVSMKGLYSHLCDTKHKIISGES